MFATVRWHNDNGNGDCDDDDDDVVDASDKIKRPVNRHNRHKVTVSFHAPMTLAISLHGDDKGMMLSTVKRFRKWEMWKIGAIL